MPTKVAYMYINKSSKFSRAVLWSINRFIGIVIVIASTTTANIIGVLIITIAAIIITCTAPYYCSYHK